MATLSTEKNLLTRQRLENALASATPFAVNLFLAFMTYIVTQLGEKQLQLLPISNLTDDENPLDGVVKIYAIYLKKQANATDAFFKVFDDAANDATAGDAILALPLFESSKESIAFFPDGIPTVDGVVQGSYTAYIGSNGTTPSTTGHGPNGFMLVGAA